MNNIEYRRNQIQLMKLLVSWALLAQILILLDACAIPKAAGKVATEEDSDHPHYQLQEPYFEIQLKGDYYFHPLQEKYFIDGNNDFLKYMSTSLQGHKPKLMFAAHTIVPPYYSVAAFLYKRVTVDSSLLQNIIQQLKLQMNVSHNMAQDFSTSYGQVKRIDYSVANRTSKIASCCSEFLIGHGEHSIRICFWWTECNDSIVIEEIEGIIKNVKLEKD